MKLLLTFILVISLFTTSCYYDNYEELNPAFGTSICDTAGTISFSTQIQPLLVGYCGTTGAGATACHGSTNTSGWPLVTYDDVTTSANSSLMDALNHTNGASAMPKDGGKLSTCDITKFQKWIDQGMLDN